MSIWMPSGDLSPGANWQATIYHGLPGISMAYMRILEAISHSWDVLPPRSDRIMPLRLPSVWGFHCGLLRRSIRQIRNTFTPKSSLCSLIH